MIFEITPDAVSHISFHKSEEFQTTPQVTQEVESTVFACQTDTTMYRIETADVGVAQELEQFAAECRAHIEGKKDQAQQAARKE